MTIPKWYGGWHFTLEFWPRLWRRPCIENNDLAFLVAIGPVEFAAWKPAEEPRSVRTRETVDSLTCP